MVQFQSSEFDHVVIVCLPKSNRFCTLSQSVATRKTVQTAMNIPSGNWISPNRGKIVHSTWSD